MARKACFFPPPPKVRLFVVATDVPLLMLADPPIVTRFLSCVAGSSTFPWALAKACHTAAPFPPLVCGFFPPPKPLPGVVMGPPPCGLLLVPTRQLPCLVSCAQLFSAHADWNLPLFSASSQSQSGLFWADFRYPFPVPVPLCFFNPGHLLRVLSDGTVPSCFSFILSQS